MTAPEQPTPEAQALADKIFRWPGYAFMDGRVAEEIDRFAAQRAAEAVEQHGRAHEGDKEPCYYCGEPCNSLAGDPGEWPISMCHPDDPGRVKYHHTRCIFDRLHPEGGAMSHWPAAPPPGDAVERALMQRALEIIHATNEWIGSASVPSVRYRAHLQRHIAAALQSERTAAASQARRESIEECAAKIRNMRGGWPTGAGDSDEWTLDDVADALNRALATPQESAS